MEFKITLLTQTGGCEGANMECICGLLKVPLNCRVNVSGGWKIDLMPFTRQMCVCSSEGDQRDLEVFFGVVEMGDEGKGTLA